MDISEFSFCVHCGHQFQDHVNSEVAYHPCDKIDCDECPGFELDESREQEAVDEADEYFRGVEADYRCDMAREDS